jgi:hypothetical protein
MYVRFGFGKAGEYRQRSLLRSRANAGLFYKCANVFP